MVDRTHLAARRCKQGGEQKTNAKMREEVKLKDPYCAGEYERFYRAGLQISDAKCCEQ